MNAGFARFVDHGLIVEAAEQLQLLAVVPLGQLHERAVLLFVQRGAGQVRRKLARGDQHVFRAADIHVLLHVVGVNRIDDSLEDRGVIHRGAAGRLDVQVHDGSAGEAIENLLKRRKAQPGEAGMHAGADVQRAHLGQRHIGNQPVRAGQALYAFVVRNDQLAVLRRPHVQLDLHRAQRDGRAEGGQGVFGRDIVEAAVRADAGIGQVAVAGNHARAAGAIRPRRASLGNEEVVGNRRLSVGIGAHVLELRVHVAREHARFLSQRSQHPPVRRDDHRVRAVAAVLAAHGDGRAHRPRVAGEGGVFHLHFQNVHALAALQGADDQHVRFFQRDMLDVFIVIVVVAGEKRVAHAVQIERIRRVIRAGVRVVQALALALGLRQMLLEIFARDVARRVKQHGDVAVMPLRALVQVDGHQRAAADGRRARLIQKRLAIGFHVGLEGGVVRIGGHGVAGLGQHDQIK